MNSLKLIYKLLIAISALPYSLLAMGVGIYISLNSIFFLNSAVKTNGVVIGFVPQGNKGTYNSKYSFSDKNGLTYTGVHHVAPAVYKIGEPVKVLYDPQFPQNSVIDDGSVHDYSFPAGLFFSGLILLSMVILIIKHL